MKKITLVGLASLLVLSGVALAGQSKEEKKGPSMDSMMEQMMGSGEMMGQMTKMMEQCTAMMGSGDAETQGTTEGQKR